MILRLLLGVAACAVSVVAASSFPSEVLDVDPCDRANIPFQGDSSTLHLSADKLAKIATRSRNLRRVWTREKVIVTPGKDEDVVVDFDIKVSDDALQDIVSVNPGENDVTVVIDGSALDDGNDPNYHECITSTISVSLPSELHHLVFDLDKGVAHLKGIKSKLKTLELLIKLGGIHVDESDFRVDDFTSKIEAGTFSTHKSTISIKKASIESKNGGVAGRFSGSPIESLDVSLGNGVASLVLLDEDSTSKDAASVISATTKQGRVHIMSYIKGEMHLSGQTSAGAVKSEIYGNVGGSFHAQTRVGHARISGPVKITNSQKTITGITVDGDFGKGDSSLDMSTNVGAIEFEVGPEKDGSDVEPAIRRAEDDGGDNDDAGRRKGHQLPGSEVHLRTSSVTLFAFLSFVVVSALAWSGHRWYKHSRASLPGSKGNIRL